MASISLTSRRNAKGSRWAHGCFLDAERGDFAGDLVSEDWFAVAVVGLATAARTRASTPPPLCGRKAIPLSKPPVDRLDVIGGGDRKSLLCALRVTVNSATQACRNPRRYPRAILICAPVIITYESFQLCRDSDANRVEMHPALVAASRCVYFGHDVV
jgi:hypothetical protein